MSKSNKHDYGDGFLYADDLVRDGKWIRATLTIRQIVPAGTITAANGKVVDKPTLLFERTEKMLSLCKTNERLVRIALGEHEHEKWVGNKITVYPTLLDDCFGERDVPAIRILAPRKSTPSGVRRQLGRDLSGKPTAGEEGEP